MKLDVIFGSLVLAHYHYIQFEEETTVIKSAYMFVGDASGGGHTPSPIYIKPSCTPRPVFAEWLVPDAKILSASRERKNGKAKCLAV